GIVHRDVSAENVLLGEDGVVRVLGFGLARAAWRRRTARPDCVRARLPYASPEELVDRHVDARSDLYAASVVLWEMLAGRRLFDEHSVEATLESVLRGPVPPPSTFAFDVSSDLDAIVLRGLARDASLRYSSAEHMATELESQPAVASIAELAELV